MPELTKQIGKLDMVKPIPLKMKVGEMRTITITAPHQTNKDLLSIPCETDKGEKGNFPLNTTSLRILQPVLGSDTDKWIGASFRVIAIPANRPNSSETTLGWAIISDSVKKPKAS